MISYDTLKLLKERKPFMKIKNDKVIETFNGKYSNGLIGEYETDGNVCNCSTYNNSHFWQAFNIL